MSINKNLSQKELIDILIKYKEAVSDKTLSVEEKEVVQTLFKEYTAEPTKENSRDLAQRLAAWLKSKPVAEPISGSPFGFFRCADDETAEENVDEAYRPFL